MEDSGATSGVQRDDTGRRLKGRGASGSSTTMGESRTYDTIASKGSSHDAVRSIEGWIIFVTGLHEEVTEDDVHDKFCDFGEIRNLHLNLDRRTGFVKGYALIEFNNESDAKGAIEEMNGGTIMGKDVEVDWAFRAGPTRGANSSRR